MMNDKRKKQLAQRLQENNSVAKLIKATTYIPNPPRKTPKASKKKF